MGGLGEEAVVNCLSIDFAIRRLSCIARVLV